MKGIKYILTAGSDIIDRMLDGPVAENMIILSELLPGDIVVHRVGAKLSVGYFLVHRVVQEPSVELQLGPRTV